MCHHELNYEPMLRHLNARDRSILAMRSRYAAWEESG
jgi:hypothetical protein